MGIIQQVLGGKGGRQSQNADGYGYNYDPATQAYTQTSGPGMKKGGAVKASASKRADGCAQRGKTRGRMV